MLQSIKSSIKRKIICYIGKVEVTKALERISYTESKSKSSDGEPVQVYKVQYPQTN